MNSRLTQHKDSITTAEEREEEEMEEMEGCSKERIAHCIQIMKKEGVPRDVIIKVMQESFHVVLTFVDR